MGVAAACLRHGIRHLRRHHTNLLLGPGLTGGTTDGVPRQLGLLLFETWKSVPYEVWGRKEKPAVTHRTNSGRKASRIVKMRRPLALVVLVVAIALHVASDAAGQGATR